MLNFAIAYVKSMRLYYAFVTGITGWIGMAYYRYLAVNSQEGAAETLPSLETKLVILVILFLTWGIGQIVNDYMGLEEDRFNAPQRPMVTGELNPMAALAVSISAMAATAFITWFYLQPVALIFLVAGLMLNVVYETAKGYGYIGNLVYGLSITMTVPYAFCASGPTQLPFLTSNHISILAVILLIHINMCFFSYFKDYEGDKAAGKQTLIVKYGLKRAARLGFVFSMLPAAAFLIARTAGLLTFTINDTFIALGLLTIFLQMWTGINYYRYPVGEKTFKSLKTSTRACTCGQAALVALFNPHLAIWIFLVTYIFVGFLFDLNSNPKS